MNFLGAVVVGQPAVLNFIQDSNDAEKWFAQLPFLNTIPLNQIVSDDEFSETHIHVPNMKTYVFSCSKFSNYGFRT